MNWGMKNRISRIIRPKTGRCVMLAVDHGYFQGPTTGLSNLGKTVAPLLPYADALMITRGAIRNWITPDADIPIILRVSGGQSILKELQTILHEQVAPEEVTQRAFATQARYLKGFVDKLDEEGLFNLFERRLGKGEARVLAKMLNKK